MIDLGDDKRISVEIRDSTLTLVDASPLTLNLTLPDQTTVGPFTPTHDSTGKYHYDYTTVQAGRHAAKWSGSIGSIPFTQTEIFNVETADISIVSLADVKTQLTKTSTTNDEDLRSWIMSASENIEKTQGICAIRTFTERIYGRWSFVLTNKPVVSITTFTPVYPWTPALAAADVTLDTTTGVVSRLDGWEFWGPYDVTYKAGRAVIPVSLRRACMLIVQHLWESRRAGNTATPSYAEQDTVTLPGWGYAIPNQAAQLLDAVPQVAGFA
jgi:hypothetical protein